MGSQDDVGGSPLGVGLVGEGDGVLDLGLVGAGGSDLDAALGALGRDLADGTVVGVVAGEGLVTGGDSGCDRVAPDDAGQVHLAGDFFTLGHFRLAAGDLEVLCRSLGRDDLAAEGGQVAG